MIVLTWLLALLVASTIVTFHVISLRRARPLIADMFRSTTIRSGFLGTSYLLALHWVEIMVFGVLYYFAEQVLHAGTVVGAQDFRDYLYFSATSYTTLGIGDLYATEMLRILSGIEALIGLILVSWTAAFTFGTIVSED